MKSGIKRTAVLGLSVVLGIGSMLPTASLAAAECKGMEKRACENAADCLWVEGYKRKDGKQVSSYCRTKSKSKSTSSTASSAKKQDDKKKDEKK